jgi:hypothetical protein
MSRKLASLLLALAAVALAAGHDVAAQSKAAAPASGGNCKTFGTGRCCDPAITAHLSKESVFSACGQSDATFLGEQGSKDTCKYFFKVQGEKDQDMYVQVYAPAVKGAAPSSPTTDPFVTWKKSVGKVMIAEPKGAKGVTNPKVKAIAADTTSAVGLYLPGNGYFTMVSASSKICSKTNAKSLAGSLR